MTTLLNPYFGEFGGMYVPQILMPALRQLEEAFVSAQKDPAFQAEFTDLLKNYAGRPTALTKCRNLTEGTKTTLYLKREDLLHGGAHKTNQVLGQALLAKRMGKTEIIAETGAGQHGVASALASALLGLKCRIYMGAKDVERQSPNVFRMRLMGAFGVRLVFYQQLQQRQGKARGLTSTGLRACHQVTTLQNGRNGLLLDGGWLNVALLYDGAQNFRVQTKGIKRHKNSEPPRPSQV